MLSEEEEKEYMYKVRYGQISFCDLPESKQTENICIEAVRALPVNLKYVKNQTSKICLTAIKSSPLSLQYVKNQTDELCLAAVKKSGISLEYVINQTEEICLAAIKENSQAFQFVKKQTDEICLAAVKEDPDNLYYVQNQTMEICLAAVMKDGFALEHVANQTKEICLAAVKQNGQALAYVKNQTDELCIEAVKNDSDAIEYVKNQTEEICRLAFWKGDPSTVIIFINPDVYKYKCKDLLSAYDASVKSTLFFNDKKDVLKKISEIVSRLSDEELVRAIDVDLKKIFRANNTKICNELNDMKTKVKLIKLSGNVSSKNNSAQVKKVKFI